MSDEKVLTKEIAEQFLEDDESVDLSEFTAIEDEAAEVLIRCTEHLDLSGIRYLSDRSAESLTKSLATISLHSLASISETSAEVLGASENVSIYSVSLDLIKQQSVDSLDKFVKAKINACGRLQIDLLSAAEIADSFDIDISLALLIEEEMREPEFTDWLVSRFTNNDVMQQIEIKITQLQKSASDMEKAKSLHRLLNHK
jgi:uncharacterized damage-inducible protein DinB